MIREAENGARLLACIESGDHFLFTVSDQRFYAEKGFDPPKRCKPCRQAKKERNAQRERPHDAA